MGHACPSCSAGSNGDPAKPRSRYPLACAPQARAAGAVLLLLKASLGVEIDAIERRMTFRNPRLPRWLDRVSILDLDVCGATIDLSIVRDGEGVSVNLLSHNGSVDVVLR